MGILNVLRSYIWLEPVGKKIEDGYKVYAKDEEGYYFEMEHDHPDPMCNMTLSRGYGWKWVKEFEIPHYIKERLGKPVLPRA